jgi:hypothetical protein
MSFPKSVSIVYQSYIFKLLHGIHHITILPFEGDNIMAEDNLASFMMISVPHISKGGLDPFKKQSFVNVCMGNK